MIVECLGSCFDHLPSLLDPGRPNSCSWLVRSFNHRHGSHPYLLTSFLLLANGGNLSRMVSALRSNDTSVDLSRGWGVRRKEWRDSLLCKTVSGISPKVQQAPRGTSRGAGDNILQSACGFWSGDLQGASWLVQVKRVAICLVVQLARQPQPQSTRHIAQPALTQDDSSNKSKI